MRVLWCWRCKVELPMLEEDEWAVLMEAHAASSAGGLDAALAMLERERERRGLPPVLRPPPDAGVIRRRLWHLIAGYALFTGIVEESANPIWHHRLSMYGPPCPECGKPLRTPKARLCPFCGWGMHDE